MEKVAYQARHLGTGEIIEAASTLKLANKLDFTHNMSIYRCMKLGDHTHGGYLFRKVNEPWADVTYDVKLLLKHGTRCAIHPRHPDAVYRANSYQALADIIFNETGHVTDGLSIGRKMRAGYKKTYDGMLYFLELGPYKYIHGKLINGDL